jgi:hypothetical protein
MDTFNFVDDGSLAVADPGDMATALQASGSPSRPSMLETFEKIASRPWHRSAHEWPPQAQRTTWSTGGFGFLDDGSMTPGGGDCACGCGGRGRADCSCSPDAGAAFAHLTQAGTRASGGSQPPSSTARSGNAPAVAGKWCPEACAPSCATECRVVNLSCPGYSPSGERRCNAAYSRYGNCCQCARLSGWAKQLCMFSPSRCFSDCLNRSGAGCFILPQPAQDVCLGLAAATCCRKCLPAWMCRFFVWAWM